MPKPDELTLEQLQQQIDEQKPLLDELKGLKAQIEKGELVSPDKAITAAVEAGTVFTAERFKGLQTTFQKEQEKVTAAQEKITTLTDQVNAFEGEKATLTSQIADLTKTNQTHETELTTLRTKEKRTKKIMLEYPELAVFEAKGLVPAAETDEDMDKIFKDFSEQVTDIQKKSAEQFGQGGGRQTPPPKKKTEKSSSDYLDLATKASLAGNGEEYEKNYDLYLEALNQEKPLDN